MSRRFTLYLARKPINWGYVEWPMARAQYNARWEVAEELSTFELICTTVHDEETRVALLMDLTTIMAMTHYQPEDYTE